MHYNYPVFYFSKKSSQCIVFLLLSGFISTLTVDQKIRRQVNWAFSDSVWSVNYPTTCVSDSLMSGLFRLCATPSRRLRPEVLVLYFGSTSGFSKITLRDDLRSHTYFTHFTYSRFHLHGLVLKFTISSNIHRSLGASRITTKLIPSISRIKTQPELISDMQVASNIPREAFATFRQGSDGPKKSKISCREAWSEV